MAALLVSSIVAGVLVPIYTDEVAWRIQLSRFAEDGWIDRATGETCGPNTFAVPPLFMWPVRLFSSGVTWVVTQPLGVRIAGVANALMMVSLMAVLIRLLAPRSPRRDWMTLFAFSLLGLGTLPFLLVWSRPEQPMLLAILGGLCFALLPPPARRRAFHARLWGVAVLGMVALCYHLKTVFYLPVFVAALWLMPEPARRGRTWPARAAAIGTLAVAGLLAGRYWAHRFACPDDPALAAKLAGENMAATLLQHGWADLGDAASRLATTIWPFAYIVKAAPKPRVMSDWLPSLPISLPALIPLIALCVLCWLAAMWVGFRQCRAAWADPARDKVRLVLGLTLFSCASGWAAFQINKNAYESALYLPVVAISALLLWSSTARDVAEARPVTLGISGVSLVSQITVLSLYLPPLWQTLAGGYLAGQRYSVSGFNYDRAAIVAAGGKCGLAPRPGQRRVLVDDLTYFAYARTDTPLYRLGVLEKWNGSIRDPAMWLHTHDSLGAVLACSYLPPGMRGRAIRTGPFCCVDTR